MASTKRSTWQLTLLIDTDSFHVEDYLPNKYIPIINLIAKGEQRDIVGFLLEMAKQGGRPTTLAPQVTDIAIPCLGLFQRYGHAESYIKGSVILMWTLPLSKNETKLPDPFSQRLVPQTGR